MNGTFFQFTEDEKLEINPDHLSVEPFRTIWELAKDKDICRKWFAFIYHFTDINSPYAVLEESLRRQTLLQDLFGRDDIVVPRGIVMGCERYALLHRTEAQRLLASAKKALHKLSRYLEELELAETLEDGKPKHNISQVVSALEKIPKMLDSVKKVEERVGEETAVGRGGAEPAMFEDR